MASSQSSRASQVWALELGNVTHQSQGRSSQSKESCVDNSHEPCHMFCHILMWASIRILTPADMKAFVVPLPTEDFQWPTPLYKYFAPRDRSASAKQHLITTICRLRNDWPQPLKLYRNCVHCMSRPASNEWRLTKHRIYGLCKSDIPCAVQTHR